MVIYCIGGSKGGAKDAPRQFLTKILPNNRFLPQTQGLVGAPCLANPGSATLLNLVVNLFETNFTIMQLCGRLKSTFSNTTLEYDYFRTCLRQLRGVNTFELTCLIQTANE